MVKDGWIAQEGFVEALLRSEAEIELHVNGNMDELHTLAARGLPCSCGREFVVGVVSRYEVERC